MAELRIGGLVRSRAGHDKNELYVIMGLDERYVYVCDGRRIRQGSPSARTAGT